MMKILISLILIMFMLISCEDSSKINIFDEDKSVNKYSIEYEVLDTFDDVDRRYKEIWDQQDNKLIEYEKGQRWAFSYHKGKTCVIVRAKTSEYSLKELETTIGHEHLHCIFGAWHK